MRRSSIPGAAIAVLLATLAAAAVAAPAGATTVTVTDDSAADFNAGVTAGTVVRSPGSVELAPTLETTFDGPGPGLPAPWTSVPWPSGGTSTVSGTGAVVVDGARLDSNVAAGPGSSLTATATFGAQPFEHVGFATDFDVEPWAMFSTYSTGTGVYARTFNGSAPETVQLLSGVTLNAPHAFRIDWTATGFVYFVDGVQVASQPVPLTAPMRPQASDFNNNGPSLSVAAMALNTHVTPGTFVSRVLDAGDDRVTAVALNPTATVPAGTSVAYEARSAAVAADLPGVAFAPVAPGGAVPGNGRYVQYRATLATTDPPATPSLDRVDAVFTIDDVGPTVTIGAAQVTGTSVAVAFSADDPAATFACSLDGGAFASCTSPVSYDTLAPGPHVLRVRATDELGNTGPTAERSFAIAAPAPPPPAGGGTPPPSGGGTPPAGDHTAPRIVLAPSTVRASRSGKVVFAVTCPRTEPRCRVTLQLTRGRTPIGRASVTIRGGRTAKVPVTLSRGARRYLATHARLRASATTVTRDAAGNRRTQRKAITILPAVARRPAPRFTG